LPEATVVIPARWASSRFPGKVLAPLGGVPLALRVCRAANRALRVRDVVVATDDARVRDTLEPEGVTVAMTREDHPSGTDRVAEVAERGAAEIVIGLQADEPFVDPRDLDALVDALAAREGTPSPAARLATLAYPIEELAVYRDPNVVKVVTDDAGRALYFSRAPVPYARDGSAAMESRPEALPSCGARTHVGVYAWRREALFDFTRTPPSPLERAEGLEQLRALAAGWTIRVLPASRPPLGVDTPEDLRRAERRLAHDEETRSA
jgi:3-deoxy-manno-octulosonate cytidylyltransferase (CMP-KDO synthetase)